MAAYSGVLALALLAQLVFCVSVQANGRGSYSAIVYGRRSSYSTSPQTYSGALTPYSYSSAGRYPQRPPYSSGPVQSRYSARGRTYQGPAYYPQRYGYPPQGPVYYPQRSVNYPQRSVYPSPAPTYTQPAPSYNKEPSYPPVYPSPPPSYQQPSYPPVYPSPPPSYQQPSYPPVYPSPPPSYQQPSYPPVYPSPPPSYQQPSYPPVYPSPPPSYQQPSNPPTPPITPAPSRPGIPSLPPQPFPPSPPPTPIRIPSQPPPPPPTSPVPAPPQPVLPPPNLPPPDYCRPRVIAPPVPSPNEIPQPRPFNLRVDGLIYPVQAYLIRANRFIVFYAQQFPSNPFGFSQSRTKLDFDGPPLSVIKIIRPGDNRETCYLTEYSGCQSFDHYASLTNKYVNEGFGDASYPQPLQYIVDANVDVRQLFSFRHNIQDFCRNAHAFVHISPSSTGANNAQIRGINMAGRYSIYVPPQFSYVL